MNIFRLLAISICIICALPASAANVNEITAKVQKQYETLSAFSADFQQTLKNVASGEEEQRSGKIYYRQPGLIRWETVKPEKELMIVGKDAVWDYFEDEKAAYRYAVEDILNSKTMLKFLSGKANLQSDFSVSLQETKDGISVLKLVPKEAEPGLVQATVYVDEKSLFKRIILQDFYGNTNDLSLKDVQLNPKLANASFEFSPPKGVQIYNNNDPLSEKNLKN